MYEKMYTSMKKSSHESHLTHECFLSLLVELIQTDSLRSVSSVLMHPTEKYLP